MSGEKSILVITENADISRSVSDALATRPEFRVVSESTPISKLNGRTSELAAEHDIVLFEAHPGDAAEVDAIRTITRARRSGGAILALTDDNITLTQARALNRVGVDEVMPRSGFAEQIQEQIAAMEARRTALVPTNFNRGRVIAVIQARGGVGSTTVAVNLADQIATERKFLGQATQHSVALVDLDLQFGTIGSLLDLPEQDTLLNMAKDGTVPDKTFLEQSMVKTETGLSVLAAPTHFAPIDSLTNDQVAAIVDTLRSDYEAVIIDMPRVLVSWMDPLLERVDELIIVTDISVPSVRHCRRLIDFLTADNPTLPIRVVVNRDRKSVFNSRMHTEAAKALERKLDAWLPDDPKAARAATDRGQPLAMVAPKSPLTRAIGRLAAAEKAALPNQAGKRI